MRITVVGTGYVGLVTGAALADFGLHVSCVDSDAQKIETLACGRVPFYETGLEELVHRNLKNGRLTFSTDLEAAVRASLAVFIAVGTPDLPDGAPDLTQVDSVVAALAECMDDYKVVVTKSTVPVGTARRIQSLLTEKQRRPVEFDLVSNPEFLREGSAVEDFMRPSRVVIGADSDRAVAVVKEIYRPLTLNGTPFVMTSLETAELIKYACNAFLATKVSFVNEMANLCEKVGADVHHLARAMGLDERIGPRFLNPGPGFGGSCFPKDLVALARTGRQLDAPQRLAETVIEINRRQRERVFSRIEGELGSLERKRIGVLGLAFKPDTDDVRGAPAIHICRRLLEAGAVVQAYDPAAMPNSRKVLNDENVVFCPDAYAAAAGVDALWIATEWNEFRDIELARVKSAMRAPVLFDSRNLFDPEKMAALGFRYFGTGRPGPLAG